MSLSYMFLDVPTAGVVGSNLESAESGITEPDRKKLKKQVIFQIQYFNKWASQPRDDDEWAEYIQEGEQLFRDDISMESVNGEEGEASRKGAETKQEQEPSEKNSGKNGGIEETAL